MTRQLLTHLSPEERAVAVTFLGYPERSIGRLMTPDYVAVRENWSIQDTLDYIREHGQDSETLIMVYVIDEQGRLLDDIHIRLLLLAPPVNTISDLMDNQFVVLKATDDQETAVAVFKRELRTALPVTDSSGILIGIVTIDDVLHVAGAAATEDIQKIGGTSALDKPYIKIALRRMIQKRAGWLVVLFLGEMFTATAMGFLRRKSKRP
jgi:magnesium transporter